MPVTEKPYQESDSHIPDPTAQTGTLDTSGTAGHADSNLKEVTPVFEVAEKQDLEFAARALDPDDKAVPEHLVTLPTGASIVHNDPEAAKERVHRKAKAAAKESIRPGGRTPAQQEAAEKGEGAAEKAQAQTESQGAGKRG